jgi:hypothetical protein
VDIRIPLYQDAKTFTNTKRRRGMIGAIGHSNPEGVQGLKVDPPKQSGGSGGGSSSGGGDNGGGYDLWLAADDEIVMDCMAFGMGCCCLQVTFQARDIKESRQLYDLLVPLAPIMLALTAAAPIFKGQLADTDCRWNVISGAVDDRTPQVRTALSVEPLNCPTSCPASRTSLPCPSLPGPCPPPTSHLPPFVLAMRLHPGLLSLDIGLAPTEDNPNR